jgi:tetratricopeptide (TPR) repeat protein
MIQKSIAFICGAALFGAVVISVVARPAMAADRKDLADCNQTVDLDRAIAGCSRFIEDSRSRPVAYATRGYIYYLKEDYDRAIADLSQAIRLDPKHANTYVGRAGSYRRKGDYDRAIADYDEALRIDPKSSFIYNQRGISYSDKGDHDRAIADQSEAIRLQPNFALAYYARGLDYESKGDHDRAIADYSDAIRADPKLAAAYNARGLVYGIKGDVDRAIAEDSEAIRLDPKYATAYNNRGSAYFEKADYDRAIADLNEAIRLDPQLALACKHRADIYLIMGDYPRALADFNEAIRINPQFVAAFTGRGLTYEKLAKISEARSDFNSALTISQKDLNAKQARDRMMAQDIARARLAALSDAPAAPATISVSAPTTSVTVNDHRIALVIGNSAYENVPALANPTRDATVVADVLKRTGFESVVLQTNLRKDALTAALRDFAMRAENADWAVVYYAGHGMEVGGVNYLVPTDAKLASDRDVSFEAVPLDQILNAAERARKLRLVILDACRDNPFASQMKRTLTVASRSVTRGLAAIEPDAGTLVVYAAKDGETAADGDGNNSPFALAFVKNLQTPGLEVRRLFDYVRDDVMEATARRQKPFSYGSISGRQDFYFVAGK